MKRGGALPRTKCCLSSKLLAVCDREGRIIVMRLTEGQMSGHRGAFMPFDAYPTPRNFWATRAMATTDTAPSRQRAESLPASHQKPIAKCNIATTRQPTKCMTWSKTYSTKSRTGGISTLARRAARMPSCQQPASPQPSSSGSINEP